jgi:hypothetical protein
MGGGGAVLLKPLGFAVDLSLANDALLGLEEEDEDVEDDGDVDGDAECDVGVDEGISRARREDDAADSVVGVEPLAAPRVMGDAVAAADIGLAAEVAVGAEVSTASEGCEPCNNAGVAISAAWLRVRSPGDGDGDGDLVWEPRTPPPLLVRRSSTEPGNADAEWDPFVGPWWAAPLAATEDSGDAWWRHDNLAARTDMAQRSMTFAASATE